MTYISSLFQQRGNISKNPLSVFYLSFEYEYLLTFFIIEKAIALFWKFW